MAKRRSESPAVPPKQVLFRATHYRDFVQVCLDPLGNAKRTGTVQKAAAAMKCHPTFVSQVLHGKSEFSVDHAIAFARHVKLDETEEQFFVLLVEKCRAGNKATQEYFDKQLKKILIDREAMANRLPELRSAPIHENSPFLRDWIPQALHQVMQLPLDPSVEVLSDTLGLPKALVHNNLRLLEELGLAENFVTPKGLRWRVLESSLHLSKKSLASLKVHANWRSKLAQDQSAGLRKQGSVHYTAICNLSAADIESFAQELQQFLDTWRPKLAGSRHEHTCVFAIDFEILSENYTRA
jgi:hypothetical protein